MFVQNGTKSVSISMVQSPAFSKAVAHQHENVAGSALNRSGPVDWNLLVSSLEQRTSHRQSITPLVLAEYITGNGWPAFASRMRFELESSSIHCIEMRSK